MQRDFRQTMERSDPDARMGGLQKAEACPGRIHEKGLSLKSWKFFFLLLFLC